MPSNVHGYRDLEADAARAGRDRRAGQRPAASERTPINPGHGEEVFCFSLLSSFFSCLTHLTCLLFAWISKGLLGISMVARPASGILPTICETITPRFKCKTLIMAISLIEIAIFISELVVGQVKFGAAFSKYNRECGSYASSTSFKLVYLLIVLFHSVLRVCPPCLLCFCVWLEGSQPKGHHDSRFVWCDTKHADAYWCVCA